MTSSPEESTTPEKSADAVESLVLHATDNGVSWITLNRPEAMNAVTWAQSSIAHASGSAPGFAGSAAICEDPASPACPSLSIAIRLDGVHAVAADWFVL